jgi:hypothetical protein
MVIINLLKLEFLIQAATHLLAIYKVIKGESQKRVENMRA